MYFEKSGRSSEKPRGKSKNLEEIQKTLKKFPKNLWPPCSKCHLGFLMSQKFKFMKVYFVDINPNKAATI